jgi:hypothetical protein
VEKIDAVCKIGKRNQIHANIVKEFKINSHQTADHFSAIKNVDFMSKILGYQGKIPHFFDIILKDKN